MGVDIKHAELRKQARKIKWHNADPAIVLQLLNQAVWLRPPSLLEEAQPHAASLIYSHLLLSARHPPLNLSTSPPWSKSRLSRPLALYPFSFDNDKPVITPNPCQNVYVHEMKPRYPYEHLLSLQYRQRPVGLKGSFMQPPLTALSRARRIEDRPPFACRARRWSSSLVPSRR